MEIIQNKRKKYVAIILIIMLLTTVCIPVFANTNNEQIYNEENKIEEKNSIKNISSKLFNLLQKIRNAINKLTSRLRLLFQKIKKPVEKSDFEIGFLKIEDTKDNMIYSPLSIKYALSMLKEGANGNTKEQIEKLLGNEDLTKYDNIDKILSLANSVYIRDTHKEHIKEEYKNELIEKYNAEVNYDSFENASNINAWIENKTLGIIKNMLKDETVNNPNIKMLLVNALAIDMEWEIPFDAEKTRGTEFYLADGAIMNATTMNQETTSDSVSYFKDEQITTLTMNLEKYNDTQLEFVAIMPEKDLSNYVKNFKIEELDNILKNTTLASETKAGLDISIPRFSFEYDLNLKYDLIKLGIKDAFDVQLANFSNMSDEKLFIGDAVHKANIDFTEKGIKAAATTVIFATCGMALREEVPIEININKPFLYVIRDKDTGEIWFMGTLYEPNSWEKDKVNYEYR